MTSMNIFQLVRAFLGTIQKKHRTTFYTGIVIMLLAQIVTSLLPLVFKPIFDSFEKGQKDPLFIFGSVAALLALEAVLVVTGMLLAGSKGAKIISEQYSRSFENLLRQKVEYHISRETGKMIANFSRISSMFWFVMIEVIWEGFGMIISFILILVVMGQLKLELLLWILGVLAVFVPVILYISNIHFKWRKIAQDTEDDMQQIAVDSFIGIDTVYSFGIQDKVLTKFNQKSTVLAKSEFNYQLTFRALEAAVGVISVIVAFIPYFLYKSDFEKGLVSASSLILLITFTFQFSAKFDSIVWKIRGILKDLPRQQRVVELMTLTHKLPNKNVGKTITKLNGSIEFNDVSFGYNDSSVLNSIHFTLEKGKTLALVGTSGSGKTTIVRLLQRYYTPKSGVISVDGYNLEDLSLESINQNLSIVPQDPVFFNSSIRENLEMIMDREVPLDELKAVCEKAQILEFIQSLPDQFDTVIGERGLKLSGGQRQRLAIARVLLKNPSIVIFDEATSMLDSDSEQMVHKSFKAMSENKTVIIIAHRLSTIIHADKILVIESGKVEEEGSHEELVTKNGRYAQLWKIQSEGLI
jgi:ATP-binding cassette, subfamily B, heavy metal transporter